MQMGSITGARKVVFCDYSDSDSNHNKTLELCASHDGKIHYESRFSPEFFDEDKAVRFVDYRGKIHLPQDVGAIISIRGDISGILHSPAFITGSSDVNLVIDKSSGLELSILTNGPIIMNGDMYRYGSGVIEKSRLNDYGRHFDVHMDSYMDYLAKIKKTPSIVKGGLFDKVDFDGSEIKYTHLDTCIHHNLVFLSKGGGIINVFYTPPFDEELQGSLKLHTMKTKYKRLERYMSYAILDENFEKAITIKNIMENLHADITRLNSKIQEEKFNKVIRNRNQAKIESFEKMNPTENKELKENVVSAGNDKGKDNNSSDNKV